MFEQQPNMGFSALQADFTDDGVDNPTFTPTYIQVLESDLADWSTQGYVLVADDRRNVPDNTTWAVYEYTSLTDESGNGTNDSLSGISRAEVKNRNFTSSHTFSGADVIIADSADQLNDIISLINGTTNWPSNQNAGTHRLENQGTLWSDFNQMSKYTDAEAQSAINNDTDHGSTAPHNYTTQAIAGTDLTKSGDTIDHSSSATSDSHHAKYTDSEARSAVEAGDLSRIDGVNGHRIRFDSNTSWIEITDHSNNRSDIVVGDIYVNDLNNGTWLGTDGVSGGYDLQKNGTDGTGIINFKT